MRLVRQTFALACRSPAHSRLRTSDSISAGISVLTLRFNSALDQTVSLGKVLAQFLAHGAASRAARGRFSVSRSCNPQKRSFSNRFRRHLSLPTASPKTAPPRRPPIPLATAASQSPQHAAKEPPRQMTLRQQQPVVAGVFNQTAPGFHDGRRILRSHPIQILIR
jgi:hypothetical protein